MSMPRFHAEVSLYRKNEHYRLRNSYERHGEDRKTVIYPSQGGTTFQGCFYGPTSWFDCESYGYYGEYNSWWSGFQCLNRYCGQGGISLVTW